MANEQRIEATKRGKLLRMKRHAGRINKVLSVGVLQVDHQAIQKKRVDPDTLEQNGRGLIHMLGYDIQIYTDQTFEIKPVEINKANPSHALDAPTFLNWEQRNIVNKKVTDVIIKHATPVTKGNRRTLFNRFNLQEDTTIVFYNKEGQKLKGYNVGQVFYNAPQICY